MNDKERLSDTKANVVNSLFNINELKAVYDRAIQIQVDIDRSVNSVSIIVVQEGSIYNTKKEPLI